MSLFHGGIDDGCASSVDLGFGDTLPRLEFFIEVGCRPTGQVVHKVLHKLSFGTTKCDLEVILVDLAEQTLQATVVDAKQVFKDHQSASQVVRECGLRLSDTL